MRVLMTTDAVGGVWQYTLALVRGLVSQHGCQVGLVCFGDASRDELAASVSGPGVELFTVNRKLEWMPGSEADIGASMADVTRIAAAWHADLLHSNQFCFGSLRIRIPVVIVGHSDILSWILWHRGRECLRSAMKSSDMQLRNYYYLVGSALKSASAVVTPSQFMADSLKQLYGCASRVIHNGLWQDLYKTGPKSDFAVIAGRLWDEAKRAETAVRAVGDLPIELHLVGPTSGPDGEAAPLPEVKNARYRGVHNWEQTRLILAHARYYLATSSYEPFGLAALEAALSGCALIANDIPSYRELWDGVALFYRRNDAEDLRRKLSLLIESPHKAEALANSARQHALSNFGAARMAEDYYSLYAGLIH